MKGIGCGTAIIILIVIGFIVSFFDIDESDNTSKTKSSTPKTQKQVVYRVPGYTGKLEGKPFRYGSLIYTPDHWGIWFKDSSGKYFCINGGAKTLTGNIPYMPGNVNAYFKAAEQ